MSNGLMTCTFGRCLISQIPTDLEQETSTAYLLNDRCHRRLNGMSVIIFTQNTGGPLTKTDINRAAKASR